MLKIEIKTGGSAYRDENDELDRSAYELRRNLKEIMEDLKRWNKPMLSSVIPFMEGILIQACDQILKFPILKEKRPDDCKFIEEMLRKDICIYRKGRSFSGTFKFVCFKYFPNLYLLKSKLLK